MIRMFNLLISFQISNNMKRKSTPENSEIEEKRVRASTNEEGEAASSQPSNGRSHQKCSICLWPVGAPQCYHTSNNMDR